MYELYVTTINMQPGDIVFDIETQRSFDEVGGRDQFHKLGISVIGAYVYDDKQYLAFEEHEIPEFEKLLKNISASNGRLIGFNIHHFDVPVLQPYISWNLRELPTLDLMADVERGVGFRVSLDNLCSETLGARKSSDGLQAIRWYREGKIEEIKKYCLKDVELTKSLYEFGIQQGHVMFFSRDARGRVAVPVRWKLGEEKDVRSVLQKGLQNRNSVAIEYVTREPNETEGAANTRVVDVHKIFGDTFEGYCHLRQAKRVFKIDRVLSARLTDDHYRMVEDVQGSLL